MKKNYIAPNLEITAYRTFDSLANENIFSDPWGFDEVADEDDSATE